MKQRLSTEPLQLLGGLTPAQFLQNYWQQRPLLIRQAVPDFLAPMDGDDLAGLACETEVESRIICGSADASNWQLHHGPFTEQSFAQLGKRDWTLLVQAVDHHIADVAKLKSRFRFIPDWRLDDVMVSFAASGGSVGPHCDQYDVFLLQGEGQWQWGEPMADDSALLAHPDLQLLQHFTPTEQHILGPGDMLYLPPGYPHWGIALEPCMTYSIGFRAPSHQEMISHYCDHVLAGIDPRLRFRDAARAALAAPGLIDSQSLEQVRDVMCTLLDERRLAQWFGCYMTEPRGEAAPAPEADQGDAGLQPEAKLAVDMGARLAYSEHDNSTVLYANGESYHGQGRVWHGFVVKLCTLQELDLAAHAELLQDAAIEAALRALIRRGVLTEAGW
jgi:50S ribosomal protein L16 3-hydroxylase